MKLNYSGLCSVKRSKNNRSFKNKIHYVIMILYLNYKNNVHKVEIVNEGGGRQSKKPKTCVGSL